MNGTTSDKFSADTTSVGYPVRMMSGGTCPVVKKTERTRYLHRSIKSAPDNNTTGTKTLLKMR